MVSILENSSVRGLNLSEPKASAMYLDAGESTATPNALDEGQILRMHMDLDDATWHWCFVFPLLTPENTSYYQQPMPDPINAGRLLFKEKCWQDFNGKDSFKAEMTRQEWHEAVRTKFVEVLTSSRNGLKLGRMKSIDCDEVFVLVELENIEALQAIAERGEIRMQVSPEAYPQVVKASKTVSSASNQSLGYTLVNEGRLSVIGVEDRAVPGCPTTNYKAGDFSLENGGKYCPMHIRYDRDMQDKFQPFREVDRIRLVKHRVREFFSLVELLRAGVLTDYYCVHRYHMVERFWDVGFTDFRSLRPIPMGQHIDMVRDYLGEEVAFFFHWAGFYTRWLLFPAILGIFVTMWEHIPGVEFLQAYVELVFAAALVMWASFFIAKYTQRSNLKIYSWGMTNLGEIAVVRKAFNKEYRGTRNEFIQNMLHWVFAICFMMETLLVVAGVNRLREVAEMLPEGETMYGMEAKTAEKIGKYLITLNIKVVDFVWSTVSPKLSDRENHRTDWQLKDAKVYKLFLVKFVVFYYPFFYIAFIKEHVAGCDDPVLFCLPELQENLWTFFVFDIISSIVILVVQILMTIRSVHAELRHAKEHAAARNKPPPKYTYLQSQSKCPDYVGDTDDMLELVVASGFVMMFSVALPIMGAISFVCNLCKLKLIAYRIIEGGRRPNPEMQEGIGSWAGIIRTIATFGVIVNTGMVIFVMHPLRELDLKLKLTLFIVCEHGMIMLMNAILFGVSDKEICQIAIEEVNADLANEVIGEHTVPVEAPPTEKIVLKMSWDD